MIRIPAGSQLCSLNSNVIVRTTLRDHDISERYVHHVFYGDETQITFDAPPNFAKSVFKVGATMVATVLVEQ